MPEGILDAGIKLILRLQNLGNWLSIPMEFFTFLGNELFYLLIAPALYWCVDTALGLRIGLYLGISSALNTVLKLAFHSPRPYWYDPRVHTLSPGSTFGIPSGHAQNAVVIWGRLASAVRGKAVWGAALILMFLIGISRAILGTHFPIDVIAGWIFGALLLLALIVVEIRFAPIIRTYSPGKKLAAALIISLMMVLIGGLLRLGLENWSLPEIWVENARTAAPEESPINPFTLKDLVTVAGTFLGLAVGAIWSEMNTGLDVRGPLTQRLLRYLLGTIGILAIWAGLDAIFPDGETAIALGFRYLRYTLIGFWITALAPVVFRRLGLAKGKSAVS